jgi:type IV pilus assembly protein PilV
MKVEKMKTVQSQAGVGLLEVLIAVLILAVGVLGISALQAITLKNSGSSASRTQAAIQIYSMLDIIRANRTNAGSFNTNIYTEGSGSGTPGTLDGWLDGLKTTISPDAKGKVVCDGGSLTCTVGVQWDDTRATGAKDAAQQAQTIEVTSQL